MKLSDQINAVLPAAVKKKYSVQGLQCGPKAEIAWAVFAEKKKGGQLHNFKGVAINEPQPAGSRIDQKRMTIDFSTVTEKQMESLLAQHCPFIVKVEGKAQKGS